MASLSDLSLQKRISLFVIAGLAVGLGLFSYLGVQSLNESTERILDQRLAMARILSDRIDETLTHVLSHLQSAADPALFTSGEVFDSRARALLETLNDTGVPLAGIVLTDREGTVLRTTSDASATVGVRWMPGGLEESLKAAVPSVSNLLADPTTGAKAVLAICPLKDDEGNMLGSLVGSLDVERSLILADGQMLQAGNTGYVEIVDGKGLVIARTDPGSPPNLMEKSDHPARFAGLIKDGQATVRTCHRCHEEGDDQVKRRRDILAFAPLSAASWGVAIRQSEEEALAPTQQLERRLFLLGITILLATSSVVWTMMQGVVRPIRTLTAAAKKVSLGDFKAVVPFRRKDEIGQLSLAFNSMTEDLARSHHELVSRNRELTALNAISVAVSQSLDLHHLLENALGKVLQVIQSPAGCVYLKKQGGGFETVAGGHSWDVFRCGNAVLATAGCACHRAMLTRQTGVVNHPSQCPQLAQEMRSGSVAGFVCVPLKSKEMTLGVMDIACPDGHSFTEGELRLLDSIGYHVGMAVENSILYGEAREKEELRGQLLSKVISAQEEERKRISRELHDESGQTLTAAIMNIESIENSVSPAETELGEKVRAVKLLVAQTLEDLRRLTLDLRPAALDDLGLVSAIRAYAKNRLETNGIHLEFESKRLVSGRRLAPPIETALFRIVQEATNNILRHAEARNVRIRLLADNGAFIASVEDDGRGFDADRVMNSAGKSPSLGLLGIQERANLLGGKFDVRSRPGLGTRITVAIPLTEYSPAAHQEPWEAHPQ